MTTRSTMLQLGYLGLVPFVFSLGLIFTDISLFNLSGQQFFIAYSAVILSFYPASFGVMALSITTIALAEMY